jgi:hypothetical protein
MLGAMSIRSCPRRKGALAHAAAARDRAGHEHAPERRGHRGARPRLRAAHRHQRRAGPLRRSARDQRARPLARYGRDRRPGRRGRAAVLARQPVPQPGRRAGCPALRPRARHPDARHLRRLPAHGARVRAQRARLRGRRARRVRPGRVTAVPDAAGLLAGRQGAADHADSRHARRGPVRHDRGRRAPLLQLRHQPRVPRGAHRRRAARRRRRRGRRPPRARAARAPVLRGDAVRAADALDGRPPASARHGFPGGGARARSTRVRTRSWPSSKACARTPPRRARPPRGGCASASSAASTSACCPRSCASSPRRTAT